MGAQTSRYAKGFDLPVRGDHHYRRSLYLQRIYAARESASVAQGLASGRHGR